jgi:hypothetical protein
MREDNFAMREDNFVLVSGKKKKRKVDLYFRPLPRQTENVSMNNQKHSWRS